MVVEPKKLTFFNKPLLALIEPKLIIDALPISGGKLTGIRAMMQSVIRGLVNIFVGLHPITFTIDRFKILFSI